MDGTKPAPGAPGTSEGVLANFFNSLLSKKTGAATPAKTGIVWCDQIVTSPSMITLLCNRQQPLKLCPTSFMLKSECDLFLSVCCKFDVKSFSHIFNMTIFCRVTL